jgi:mono/diheme cytochrome c family protein
LRTVRLPLILIAFVLFGAPSLAVAAARFDLPDGPGRELVYGHCQTCHDLQSVEDSAGIRRGAWAAVLDNMKEFGLRISEEQHDRILNYLGTWLGPNPPAEQTFTAPVEQTTVDGVSVFNDTCIACHQEDGKGKPGEFPPLAGNHDLFLATDFPAYVVLNGIEGPLKVNGKSFDNIMPAFDFLSDEEIAAVIGYVRSSWGNDTIRPSGVETVTAGQVQEIRAKAMSGNEVMALRQSLLE